MNAPSSSVLFQDFKTLVAGVNRMGREASKNASPQGADSIDSWLASATLPRARAASPQKTPSGGTPSASNAEIESPPSLDELFGGPAEGNSVEAGVPTSPAGSQNF
jgi:hypothetical protein